MRIRSGALSFLRTGFAISSVALLLAACATVPEPRRQNYLHVLDTQVSRGVDPDRPLRVAVRSNDIQKSMSVLDPARVLEVGAEEMILDLSRYPALDDRTVESSPYLQPSFVIDYDSSEVEEWSMMILSETVQAPPSVDQIAESVRSGVEGTSARGFDFASKVASVRRGDCTEHAVLFAALARRFGYPTRVTLGTIIVSDVNGRFQAFGHAWNEVLTSEGWSMVDATGISEGVQAAYIPLGYLTNEGPGYAGVLAAILLDGVRSIHILGNVASDRSR